MKILYKILVLVMIIGFTSTGASAHATPGTQRALDAITTSGGHYVRASATIGAADCSGLVSVAQSLAMGQPPHRLGNTTSLLAGQWPNAIPGATPDDTFIIGVNPGHMVARVQGVDIESRSSGEPFRIGADAASPFDPQFRQYHIDPLVIEA
jgi:hypothetical protein